MAGSVRRVKPRTVVDYLFDKVAYCRMSGDLHEYVEDPLPCSNVGSAEKQRGGQCLKVLIAHQTDGFELFFAEVAESLAP